MTLRCLKLVCLGDICSRIARKKALVRLWKLKEEKRNLASVLVVLAAFFEVLAVYPFNLGF